MRSSSPAVNVALFVPTPFTACCLLGRATALWVSSGESSRPCPGFPYWPQVNCSWKVAVPFTMTRLRTTLPSGHSSKFAKAASAGASSYDACDDGGLGIARGRDDLKGRRWRRSDEEVALRRLLANESVESPFVVPAHLARFRPGPSGNGGR
jgi:hypothetical protein